MWGLLKKSEETFMGLKKSQQLLAEGKITKSEYDKRVRMSREHRKSSNSTKQVRRANSTPRNPRIVRVTAGPRVSVADTRSNNVLQNLSGNIAAASGIEPYVKSMMDPKNNMSRIPDGAPRETAIVRSINEFNLAVSMDANTNGRFSFCARPVLGDTSTPSSYQLGIADVVGIAAGTTPWADIDWSSPTSYVSAPAFGQDPRMDVNNAILTAAPPVSFGANSSSANLNTSNLILPGGTPLNTNIGDDLVFKADVGAGVSGLVLPFGDWVVSLVVKFSVTALPAGNAALLMPFGTGVVVGDQNPQTSVTSTGTVYIASGIFNVQSSRGTNTFGVALTDTTGFALKNSTVTSVFYQANSSVFGGGLANDSGSAQEIRPVGMSVLISYMGSTLNDGGQVSIALVPGDLIENNYYSQGQSGAGQLQFEEKVRYLDRAYNGRLAQGAYAFWTPYTTADLQFRPPSLSNSSGLPGIICSGVAVPDATQTGITMPIRVELCVIFEFVTKNTDRELVNYPGSQMSVDFAWQLLKSERVCRANGEHLMWIKAMYGKLRSFAVENKNLLIPLAKAAFMATGL